MKYIMIIALSICVLALLEGVNAKTCDEGCDKQNECCKDFGVVKSCLGLRAENETCGGKFLCECALGYSCKEREESFWNPLKIGSGICTAHKVEGIVREVAKGIFEDD